MAPPSLLFLDKYSILPSLLLTLPSLISTCVATAPESTRPSSFAPQGTSCSFVHNHLRQAGLLGKDSPMSRDNGQLCSHGFPISLTPTRALSTAFPHLPSICFQATGSLQIPKPDFPVPESITATTQPALPPVLPSIHPPTSGTDVLSYLTNDSKQDLVFPLL